MKHIETEHGNLATVDVGNGAGTLLFVHGFPLDHTMWRTQINSFAKDYRVIAPDLRGFGASQFSKAAEHEIPKSISMQEYADDLRTLLNELDVTPPLVYCGLSMGGYIGWQFVRRYSEKVAAFIQCDTRAASDSLEVARARRMI